MLDLLYVLGVIVLFVAVGLFGRALGALGPSTRSRRDGSRGERR